MRSAAPIVAALLLAPALWACSAEPEQPGGVTADEAQQLNEAAAMLDANSIDADSFANGSSPTR